MRIAARIVQGTQGVNLPKKAGFKQFPFLCRRTNTLSGLTNCELSGYMKGNLDALDDFWRKGEGRRFRLKRSASVKRIQIRSPELVEN
jgi:hypothetical protein